LRGYYLYMRIFLKPRPMMCAVPGVLLLSLGLAAQNPPAAQTPPAAPMQHKPGMQHTPGMQHDARPMPTQGGQAAFAAIGEIVKLLEADPNTDWSKVNLEALRQHLADMDMVTLHSRVEASQVANGLVMDVTGDALVAAAIKRMLVPHATMLAEMPAWNATTAAIARGVRLTVTAKAAGDEGVVARIRGLGFAGLLVQGDHHTEHHMMLARGARVH
jgi:hypothetical protein